MKKFLVGITHLLICLWIDNDFDAWRCNGNHLHHLPAINYYCEVKTMPIVTSIDPFLQFITIEEPFVEIVIDTAIRIDIPLCSFTVNHKLNNWVGKSLNLDIHTRIICYINWMQILYVRINVQFVLETKNSHWITIIDILSYSIISKIIKNHSTKIFYKKGGKKISLQYKLLNSYQCCIIYKWGGDELADWRILFVRNCLGPLGSRSG